MTVECGYVVEKKVVRLLFTGRRLLYVSVNSFPDSTHLICLDTVSIIAGMTQRWIYCTVEYGLLHDSKGTSLCLLATAPQ